MLKSQRLEFRVDKENGNLKRSSHALSKLAAQGTDRPRASPKTLVKKSGAQFWAQMLGPRTNTSAYTHPS